MKNIYSFRNLSQESGCIHLVTTKNIEYDYNFSLALHTNEEPKSILQNRDKIQQKFPNMKFIVANQTHSDHISIITDVTSRGWDSIDSAIDDCDALITNQKGVMLTILTADCVPILLFDTKQKVISAIHAGWRGTEQQIVIKTIKKMEQEFNSNPKDILAGIAPSIGRCCYEVDWGVAQHFQEYDNAFDRVEDKYMLDLPHINRLQLIKVGVREKNIELSSICTACEVDNYFSYRKEKGCSGRFMSMIGMT
ncbi:MAG TPA: peptidoglycan editing factor PgeF [Campylobacterales bacterium]|nr:peptidoglycan editing factor PgeF [Campylobacterales bacterium]